MSIINFIKNAVFLIILETVNLLIRLRYRIRVKGLEQLDSMEGTLILPNHPAEIDPIIVMLALWKKFKPRPLIVEHFYYLKGCRFLMKRVGAVPLPNFDTAKNKWKARQVEKLFHQLIDELKSGHNFLIYPAGKLKHTALEAVGGASFVPNLLQAYPEVNVLLVRTTGLWGSRFSRALTGRVPNFGATLWECFKIVCANGIFFTPRREVVIEIEKAGPDFPVRGSRMQVNRYLEAWFNQKGAEPLQLVSDRFWKYVVPQVKKIKDGETSPAEELSVPPEIEAEILDHIALLVGRPKEKITRGMSFSQDLGLDSLDIAGIYAFLFEKYDIANLPQGQLQTVEDVMRAAAGYKKETVFEQRKEQKTKRWWPAEKNRPDPAFAIGETIAEAFLRSCDRMDSKIACADGLSGPLSYRRLKQTALILSAKMKELPGEHIGVLLPSSAGTYLTILAILLAKKIPVMLNWTTGVRALNHAVQLTELKAVVTSRRFLDRLENGDLGDVDDKLVFLEGLREGISLRDKIRGWILSWKKAPALLQKLGLEKMTSTDTAVVIFTSGTEALPKGVPLSHANILINQRSAMQWVPVDNTDILFAVLPPFHSFGFSATGLLPLLMGLKVFYAADPTDSQGMAHDMAQVRPTLFICAPGFIRALFRVASAESLQSLKLLVSGAEKAPQDLFEGAKRLAPQAQVIEGYGITECSPVVTLNRPGRPLKGVGQPIPGVTLCVIDPISLEPVPQGEEGEVCIAGPNVFAGYLGTAINPFLDFAGKKWYRSGDRGYLDPDGSLFLTGRLKRFVKIGGEMVSLGGIEEELLRLARERGWVTAEAEDPTLAVSVKEKDSERPVIVLYATFEVSRDEVNAALFANGFGRLAKVGEVLQVKEIPMTGTGKTHHRLLDEREFKNVII